MILIPAFPFHVTKQLHIPLLIHHEHLPPVHSIFTLCDSTLLLEPSQHLQQGILIPPPRLCVNTFSSISAALPYSLWVSPRAGEGRQQRREAASIAVMVDLMLLCLKGNLAANSVSVTCQHPNGSDIRMNIIFFLSPRVNTGLFKGFACQNSPNFSTKSDVDFNFTSFTKYTWSLSLHLHFFLTSCLLFFLIIVLKSALYGRPRTHISCWMTFLQAK